MDRGFVFTLIQVYLKNAFVVLQQVSASPEESNLAELRLDFYQIVCSHEHYVALNLPLGGILYPMDTCSSPLGSTSSTFENLVTPNYTAMGKLSQEFKKHHYLSGLLLSELALVLDNKLDVIVIVQCVRT